MLISEFKTTIYYITVYICLYFRCRHKGQLTIRWKPKLCLIVNQSPKVGVKIKFAFKFILQIVSILSVV